jgi:two-component system, CAI-1 autoinducer sensor kinase/phosphatase CqsS
VKPFGFRQEFREFADRSWRYSERHIQLFGLIAVVAIPLTTFVERAVTEPSFDTIYIRIAAALAGLPLLFHSHLPKSLKQRVEYIWVASITIILPLCFGAILTFNAALTSPGDSVSPIWVYQYLVALFIFIQLLNHALFSILLWAIASSVVLLLCLPIEHVNVDGLREAWLYPAPVYLTALLVGIVTNRNVHMVQAEQLRAAAAIGANIAHELRTPLASIRLVTRTLRRHVPILVDSYKATVREGNACDVMTKEQFDGLSFALTTIEEEVDYSNTIIDMLLINTTDGVTQSAAHEYFLASTCASEAVSRYPFNNSRERGLVSIKMEKDFSIVGSKLLIVHVLFNLLKNAVYYSQRSQMGSVTIQIGAKNDSRSIFVTDTGPGISQLAQRHIFDQFFSTSSAGQGAGVGLSFCKTVMESIGGHIECESVEGQYTTFKLFFPPIKDDRTPSTHSGQAGETDPEGARPA